MADPFNYWIDSIFDRWLGELTHKEIARALKVLTYDYVQRRDRLRGKALSGRGKQAAFALYYGVRHFVIVRETLIALKIPEDVPKQIVDLGCGTGVAGAAWSLHCGGEQTILGVEFDPNILREAEFTYKYLKLRGHPIHCHLSKYRWPEPSICVIASFILNELNERDREHLWHNLKKQVKGGSRVLILEPLATRITPWWRDWIERVKTIGGRADEWHFDVELPERVHLLGKSAGLRPNRLGARVLWI